MSSQHRNQIQYKALESENFISKTNHYDPKLSIPMQSLRLIECMLVACQIQFNLKPTLRDLKENLKCREGTWCQTQMSLNSMFSISMQSLRLIECDWLLSCQIPTSLNPTLCDLKQNLKRKERTSCQTQISLNPMFSISMQSLRLIECDWLLCFQIPTSLKPTLCDLK